MQFWWWFEFWDYFSLEWKCVLGCWCYTTYVPCFAYQKEGQKYPYLWELKLLGCMLQHIINCFLVVGQLHVHLSFPTLICTCLWLELYYHVIFLKIESRGLVELIGQCVCLLFVGLVNTYMKEAMLSFLFYIIWYSIVLEGWFWFI